MKKLTLLACSLLVCTVTYAQQVSALPDKSTPTANMAKLDTGKTPHPLAIQLHGGSQGLGLDLRYGLTPRISLRLGGSSMFPVKVDDVFNFSGFTSENTVKGKLANVHLLADLHPFKTSAFKFVVGAGYMFKANGAVKFTPTGSYSYGGLNLTGQEIGDLDIDLSWKGFAPYVGLGLFKSFPKKTFNVSLDLGTYYLTAPNSTITGTKTLADNSSVEPQLNENMKDYRFLPVLQLNFNFRIK